MTILAVFGAKGGVGASLVASNLAVLLAQEGACLLVDLASGLGYDDLLLDLQPERSWGDLLPVADEIEARHLELTVAIHPSGARLLAAPSTFPKAPVEKLSLLLRSLHSHYDWLVLDVPWATMQARQVALSLSQAAVLVVTGDPPALRNAKRIEASLSKDAKERVFLILNQYTPRHPGSPGEVAASLGLELLAALPTDSQAVGYQVNFGQVASLDGRSPLGRAMNVAERRLVAEIRKLETGSEVGMQGRLVQAKDELEVTS